MSPISFPSFGTYVLLGVMLVASYTLSIALAAGSNGKPRTLQAARFGAYGTVGLIAVAVLCLAYSFVTHDFRIRYVSHYSDRSMPFVFLLTALWGGQDGSLLWWLFLLSLYIGGCVFWLGKKYLELQPYIIATLMAVVLFFCVVMAFAANPFGISVAGAKPDGEGLNPLLQNFYMIIHPPSLYVGFVGCTIPFGFAVAALVTGRLDQEWIVASRKWMLFAWMFLGFGNTLGMLWAYEELGWGGYWAWDPVENAAFMPFLTASAFVHSVMVQERRGMLKVWNMFLITLTFFMTILGTCLTRSGLIASVHSFAQSSIGIYFVGFMIILFAFSMTLILYRWPELRGLPPRKELRWAAMISGWLITIACGPLLYLVYRIESLNVTVRVLVMALIAGGAVYAAVEVVFRRMTQGIRMRAERPEFESVLSREFTFMLNNWALLSFTLFVLVASIFPLISEYVWNEKVTVGPPYYNAWVQPLGLVIFFLMGAGTLLGWKKTSNAALRRAFMAPTITFVVAVVLQLTAGKALGYPGIVWSDPIYGGGLGQALKVFNAITPVLGFGLAAFNAAIIVQEFVMLYKSRAKTGANKGTPAILYYLGFLPGFLHTMVSLSPQSRRRYGGYIVHLGIVLMFIGFTGKSWTVDRETALLPGQTYEVMDYKLEYAGPRMEVDNTKRMVFADVKVTRNGKPIGQMSPAKFIYKKSPESPTTEIALMRSIANDLYLVIGTVNPQTKLASFQIHVNPLVNWIWFGCGILLMGSFVCMWPELVPGESRAWQFARGTASVAASLMLGIFLALMPTPAYGQTSSAHAGTVRIDNEVERDVFAAIRCMCGGCDRLPLTSCACPEADDMRADVRAKLAAGMSKEQIMAIYAKEHGTDSLTVPPNKGALRAIYMLPLGLILLGGIGLVVAVGKWRKPSGDATSHVSAGTSKDAAATAAKKPSRDEYDARLDEELRDLDG